MEFRELHYGYTTSAARCIREVISPLAFYSQEARTQEIDKYNSDNLWKFVGDRNRCNLVAIDNGEVVGFLFGSVDANVLFVNWVGMRERYRNSTHMITLSDMMETWCYDRGIRKVWCDTVQSNIPAVRFVEKMGYTKLANVKNFWYGHDYFLWEKTLDG